LSSQNFDVIIAGVGIAGCSAARFIARNRYRVALIDALPDFCAIYYNGNISHGGYCWIIPKRDNLVNTGILIPSSRNIDANFLKSVCAKEI